MGESGVAPPGLDLHGQLLPGLEGVERALDGQAPLRPALAGLRGAQWTKESGALVEAGTGHFHVAVVFAQDLLSDVQAEADVFLAVAGGAGGTYI